MDTRVRGKMTAKLSKIVRDNIDPSELLDPGAIPMRTPSVARLPLCESCTDRCCVHREPDTGILLSLRDVAHLVDSGLGHLIVGKFTFQRGPDGRLGEVEEMPRLKKKQNGLCHFYDEKSGKCQGYGVRPTICRRFPYEIGYRKGTAKPFAQFIPWATCPTARVPADAAPVRQMARDAAHDENVSYEDVILLPQRIAELRRAGFARFLPPAENGARPAAAGRGRVPKNGAAKRAEVAR